MEKRISLNRLIGIIIISGLCTACIDTIATANVWNDENCNGRQDKGELPLRNICIQYAYGPNVPTPSESECQEPFALSNSEGYWSSGNFISCDNLYEVIRIPIGYELTTNRSVQDCHREFGLAHEGTCKYIQNKYNFGKALSGAFIWIIFFFLVVIINIKKGNHSIKNILTTEMAVIIIGIIMAFISMIIPTIIDPWINYLGFPILQIAIILLLRKIIVSK